MEYSFLFPVLVYYPIVLLIQEFGHAVIGEAYGKYHDFTWRNIGKYSHGDNTFSTAAVRNNRHITGNKLASGTNQSWRCSSEQ